MPDPDAADARWDARYRARLADEPADLDRPDAFLVAHERFLPAAGRALDIAAGLGRNALWLARRGLRVVAVDVSPVACDRLRRRAAELGLPVTVLCRDLEREALPPGPFELVINVNYLQRSLSADIVARLAPGGALIFVTMLKGGTGPPPIHAEYCLERGELPRLFPALERLAYMEDPPDAYRPRAGLVARKTADGD